MQVLLTILHLHHLNAWADLVALRLKLVGVVMTLPIGLEVDEDPKSGITSKSSLERMVRENKSRSHLQVLHGRILLHSQWRDEHVDRHWKKCLERHVGSANSYQDQLKFSGRRIDPRQGQLKISDMFGIGKNQVTT